MTISVYDADKSNLVGISDEFAISIELGPNGAIFGQVLISTVEKVAKFNGLQIKSSGKFYIKASCGECNDELSEDFDVIDIALDHLVVDSENSSPSAYFYVTFTIHLRDQADDSWLSDTLVVLEDSNLFHGTSSNTASQGFTTFTVYFFNSGNIELTAKAGSVEKKAQINVLKNLLKIVEISQTVMHI